jgi:hypothetical protein
MALIGLSSAHLGDPLVLILIGEEPTKAARILEIASKLTPKEYQLQFSKLSSETLLRSGDTFKGKAVSGFDMSVFKRSQLDLTSLVLRSSLTNNQLIKSKTLKAIETVEALGPTAWVTIAQNDEAPSSQHPFFLTIPIESEVESLADDYDQEVRQCNESSDLLWHCAVVNKALQRLRGVDVKIPFADMLKTHMQASNVPDGPVKLGVMLRVIKNIVRMNNAPSLTAAELLDDYFGMPIERNAISSLIATKKDYYVFWLLMDGIIPTGREGVTPRDLRVFNAIKNHAFGPADADGILTFFPSADSDRTRLRTVQASTRRWSDKDRIIENLSKDGGERLSPIMVHRILKEFVKKKLIMEMKDPEDRNSKRILYQVDTLSIDAGLQLPHPSTILDPLNPAGTMQVVNPFTGQNETI